MRIVTILIFLALAAGAYVVHSARNEPMGGDSQRVAAQLHPKSMEPSSSDASGGDGESGGSSAAMGAKSAGSDLPDSFPSELKRRSSEIGSRELARTMSNEAEDAGPEPSDPPTLKPSQPRRPARAVSMPSRPEESKAPKVTETPKTMEAAEKREVAITNITLPVEPATVADATVEETASDAKVIDADVSEPEAQIEGNDGLGEVAEFEEAEAEEAVPSIDEGLPATTSGLIGSVVDGSGKAIPKVEIDVLDRATGESLRTLKADDKGQFTALDLAAGEYALAVRKASVPLGISAPIGTDLCHQGEVPAGYGAICVNVAAAGDPTAAQIVLPLSSGVQGTILGLSGKPEGKVLVRAISKVPGFGEHAIVASTDDEGFFFLSLVPGPYELQMLLPGDGAPEDMARSMDVTAKPGSALLLEAVDFSKPDPVKKSVRAVPAAAPSREESVTAASAPLEPVIQGQEIKLKGDRPVVVLRELDEPAEVPVKQSPVEPEKAPREEVADAKPVKTEAPQPVPVPAKKAVEKRPEVALPVEAKPIVVAPIEVETADSEIVVAGPEADAPEEGAEEGAEGAAGAGRVELRGRIISKWGESLPAMSVLAETPDGTVVEMTRTSDSGSYVLESVPVGSVIVHVARDLDLNRDVEGKATLLKRPEPMEIRTFSGQKRVTLEDVVVDVRRVYRLSGKITIGEEAFQEFKKTIRPIKRGQDFLTDEQYRRAYYRGLRLVQKNRGGEAGGDRPTTARGQSIPIAPDGTFVWSCTLPADDIVLVLEPRSGRKDGGYRGAIGIPVTPAGVRPASIEVTYPAAPAKKKSGNESEASEDVSPPAEASVLAEGAPTAPTH